MNNKKAAYCINCNTFGHYKNRCDHPIISNGVILFKIDGEYMLNNIAFEYFMNNHYDEQPETIEVINTNIKFLMIQRRHSLGYLEFIRGKYDVNRLDDMSDIKMPCINYLIQQMDDDEIDDIVTEDFDKLWFKLWGDHDIKESNHYEEYKISKSKFEEFKNRYDTNMLSKSLYGYNEWGFPKGRRNKYEDDYKCAVREFIEETKINVKKIKMFKKISVKQEYLVGTNGINYMHKYYLGYAYENIDMVDMSVVYDYEVKNMLFLDADECIQKIRPYHTDKIKIINKLHNCINSFINNAY